MKYSSFLLLITLYCSIKCIENKEKSILQFKDNKANLFLLIQTTPESTLNQILLKKIPFIYDSIGLYTETYTKSLSDLIKKKPEKFYEKGEKIIIEEDKGNLIRNECIIVFNGVELNPQNNQIEIQLLTQYTRQQSQPPRFLEENNNSNEFILLNGYSIDVSNFLKFYYFKQDTVGLDYQFKQIMISSGVNSELYFSIKVVQEHNNKMLRKLQTEDTCLTSDANDANYCTSCNTNFYLIEGKCFDSCPSLTTAVTSPDYICQINDIIIGDITGLSLVRINQELILNPTITFYHSDSLSYSWSLNISFSGANTSQSLTIPASDLTANRYIQATLTATQDTYTSSKSYIISVRSKYTVTPNPSSISIYKNGGQVTISLTLSQAPETSVSFGTSNTDFTLSSTTFSSSNTTKDIVILLSSAVSYSSITLTLTPSGTNSLEYSSLDIAVTIPGSCDTKCGTCSTSATKCLTCNEASNYYQSYTLDNCKIKVCGDTYRVSTETCDDGNTVSGDGCSSTCQTESGITCVKGTGGVGLHDRCCSSTCDVCDLNATTYKPVCTQCNTNSPWNYDNLCYASATSCPSGYYGYYDTKQICKLGCDSPMRIRPQFNTCYSTCPSDTFSYQETTKSNITCVEASVCVGTGLYKTVDATENKCTILAPQLTFLTSLINLAYGNTITIQPTLTSFYASSRLKFQWTCNVTGATAINGVLYQVTTNQLILTIPAANAVPNLRLLLTLNVTDPLDQSTLLQVQVSTLPKTFSLQATSFTILTRGRNLNSKIVLQQAPASTFTITFVPNFYLKTIPTSLTFNTTTLEQYFIVNTTNDAYQDAIGDIGFSMSGSNGAHYVPQQEIYSYTIGVPCYSRCAVCDEVSTNCSFCTAMFQYPWFYNFGCLASATNCPTGFYGYNLDDGRQVCQEGCPLPMRIRQQLNTCHNACPSGTYAYKVDPNQAQTNCLEQCVLGTYPVNNAPSESTCATCFKYCQLCSTGTTCNQCQLGFSLSTDKKTCSVCTQNCQSCPQYFTLQSQSCIPCTSNCNICYYGYFLVEDRCVATCPEFTTPSTTNSTNLTCRILGPQITINDTLRSVSLNDDLTILANVSSYYGDDTLTFQWTSTQANNTQIGKVFYQVNLTTRDIVIPSSNLVPNTQLKLTLQVTDVKNQVSSQLITINVIPKKLTITSDNFNIFQRGRKWNNVLSLVDLPKGNVIVNLTTDTKLTVTPNQFVFDGSVTSYQFMIATTSVASNGQSSLIQMTFSGSDAAAYGSTTFTYQIRTPCTNCSMCDNVQNNCTACSKSLNYPWGYLDKCYNNAFECPKDWYGWDSNGTTACKFGCPNSMRVDRTLNVCYDRCTSGSFLYYDAPEQAQYECRQICGTGYYGQTSPNATVEGQCKKCLPYCANCTTNSTCTLCSSGFSLINSNTKCIVCKSNCASCPQYFTRINNLCVPCQSNCQICYYGYYLLEDKCVEVCPTYTDPNDDYYKCIIRPTVVQYLTKHDNISSTTGIIINPTIQTYYTFDRLIFSWTSDQPSDSANGGIFYNIPKNRNNLTIPATNLRSGKTYNLQLTITDPLYQVTKLSVQVLVTKRYYSVLVDDKPIPIRGRILANSLKFDLQPYQNLTIKFVSSGNIVVTPSVISTFPGESLTKQFVITATEQAVSGSNETINIVADGSDKDFFGGPTSFNVIVGQACEIQCGTCDNNISNCTTCNEKSSYFTDEFTGTCVLAACGDKVITSNEQCDDGNSDDLDGCSSTCQIEDGYMCTKTKDKGSICCSESCKECYKDDTTNNVTCRACYYNHWTPLDIGCIKQNTTLIITPNINNIQSLCDPINITTMYWVDSTNAYYEGYISILSQDNLNGNDTKTKFTQRYSRQDLVNQIVYFPLLESNIPDTTINAQIIFYLYYQGSDTQIIQTDITLKGISEEKIYECSNTLFEQYQNNNVEYFEKGNNVLSSLVNLYEDDNYILSQCNPGSTCQNGGVCQQSSNNGYKCTCSQEYSGIYCNFKKDIPRGQSIIINWLQSATDKLNLQNSVDYVEFIRQLSVLLQDIKDSTIFTQTLNLLSKLDMSKSQIIRQLENSDLISIVEAISYLGLYQYQALLRNETQAIINYDINNFFYNLIYIRGSPYTQQSPLIINTQYMNVTHYSGYILQSNNQGGLQQSGINTQNTIYNYGVLSFTDNFLKKFLDGIRFSLYVEIFNPEVFQFITQYKSGKDITITQRANVIGFNIKNVDQNNINPSQSINTALPNNITVQFQLINISSQNITNYDKIDHTDWICIFKNDISTNTLWTKDNSQCSVLKIEETNVYCTCQKLGYYGLYSKSEETKDMPVIINEQSSYSPNTIIQLVNLLFICLIVITL